MSDAPSASAAGPSETLSGAAPVPGTTRHIPSLDGLRAISFLVVFVAHAGLDRFIPGGFGVTVFFFLSGFLITTLMRAEYDRNSFVKLKHFWLRRALRILPPCYIVLAAAIAGAAITDSQSLSGAGISAQLLQLTNYWIIYRGDSGLPAGGGTSVYWSLAVEEHFYLIFPWVYVALRKVGFPGKEQALILWGICVMVLAWRCHLVLQERVSMNRTYMASDTRIDSILFGCALAVWHNPTLDFGRFNEKRWKYLYFPFSLVILGATFLYRDPLFRETVRYSAQGVALTLVFIAAVKFPRWLPFRLLNIRPMAIVGLLSYSLYLMHFGVVMFVQARLPEFGVVAQGIIAFSLCLVLAGAMYVLVEKPCARLRRKLID